MKFHKTIFRTALFFIVSSVILISLLSACTSKLDSDRITMPNKTQDNVYSLHRDWLYNPEMPLFFPYIAALQDYVFVGEVVSDPVPVKLGSDDNYEIYSQYDVVVLLNIRGTLTYATKIPVLKDGGFDKEKGYYILNEHDSLPQKGEVCVIAASNMVDGSYRLSTCGPTTFTAIGIAEEFYKDQKYLSNGVAIVNKTDYSKNNISLSSCDKFIDIQKIENGIIVSNELINKPGSSEVRELLMSSSLVTLWTEAVSEEYAVECKRERIMDSPYGIPGSPSYIDEQTLPFPGN